MKKVEEGINNEVDILETSAMNNEEAIEEYTQEENNNMEDKEEYTQEVQEETKESTEDTSVMNKEAESISVMNTDDTDSNSVMNTDYTDSNSEMNTEDTDSNSEMNTDDTDSNSEMNNEDTNETKENAIKKEMELIEALNLDKPRFQIKESVKNNVTLCLAELALLVIMAVLISYNTANTRPHLNKELSEQVSEFNCGLEDDKFYVEPVTLKTELNGYDAHISLDIPRENIISIDNYDNFTLAVYNEGDELKQLLISDSIPKEIESKELNAKKLGKETLVKVNETSAESMKKLSGGYIYYEENKETAPKAEEIKDKVDKISNSIQYSEHNSTHNVKINIDGLGSLDLNKLSVFQNDAGMYYGKDNILRLYNNKEDIAYIWITHINNPLMMNPIGNLQSTEYNNVYVDVDYDNPEKMGYKTYAIMTDKGLYSVKFNEKAPEGLEDEFLESLGINRDDAKIELQFKLNE